jgi:hypothetical protein
MLAISLKWLDNSLPGINHFEPEWHDGEAGHFQVLGCKWQADDGDGEEQRQE